MNERTDHQVLVSIAQLLEEILAEVRHTRARSDDEEPNDDDDGRESIAEGDYPRTYP